MIVIHVLPILVALLLIAVIVVGVLVFRRRAMQCDATSERLVQAHGIYGLLLIIAAILAFFCTTPTLLAGYGSATKLIGGRGGGMAYTSSRQTFWLVYRPDGIKVFPKDEHQRAEAHAEQVAKETGRLRVPVHEVSVSTIKSWHGFWGMTNHKRSVNFSLSWYEYGAQPEDEWSDTVIEIENLIGETLIETGPEWWAEYGSAYERLEGLRPAQGPPVYRAHGEMTERYLPGYIHNIITLLAFAAVPFCFARWRTYRRAAKLAEHGRCIRCGYDLRGKFDHGCPECGWRRKRDKCPQ